MKVVECLSRKDVDDKKKIIKRQGVIANNLYTAWPEEGEKPM